MDQPLVAPRELVFREILRASAALDRKCSQPGRQAAFWERPGRALPPNPEEYPVPRN